MAEDIFGERDGADSDQEEDLSKIYKNDILRPERHIEEAFKDLKLLIQNHGINYGIFLYRIIRHLGTILQVVL